MSQEDLDKLFQQNSDEHDFKYNEEAWSHMESLLEKDDRRYFGWWRWGYIGLILIGIVGFFTIYQVVSTNEVSKYDNHLEHVKTPSNNDLTEKANNNVSSTLINETNKELNAIEETDLSSDTEKDMSPNLTSTSTNRTPTNNRDKTKYKDQVTTSQTIPTPNSSSSINLTNSDQLKKSPDVQSNNNSISNATVGSSIAATTSKAKDKIQDFPLPIILVQSKVSYLEFEDGFNLPELNFVEIDFDNDNSTTINPPKENQFLIGFAASGEVSTVGMDNVCTPDLKFGLQAEYRFKNRFGVNLAANYIKKDYGASGDEYFPPNGFWEDGIAPETARGLCDIIETSINGTYYFGKEGYRRNGFYTTLGLTSYTMLRQEYWYSYENQTPLSKVWWLSENESSFWFSMGHVSLGYQFKLKEKTSVQIEPYMKLPLSGVGHGQVNITSFGLTGRFNFQIK